MGFRSLSSSDFWCFNFFQGVHWPSADSHCGKKSMASPGVCYAGQTHRFLTQTHVLLVIIVWQLASGPSRLPMCRAIHWGDNCIIAWGLFYTDPEAVVQFPNNTPCTNMTHDPVIYRWSLKLFGHNQCQGSGADDSVACISAIAKFLLIFGCFKVGLVGLTNQ